VWRCCRSTSTIPERSDGKAPGEKIDVELSCPPDPTLIAAMQVLEQVWTGSELVNVTLTQFDQATHINNAVSDTHQAHCWRWGGEGDPSASLNPFVAPAAESVANFPNYDDPEMQAWAAEANATDDFETRKELYGLINTRINELNLTWYSGGTAVMVAHAGHRGPRRLDPARRQPRQRHRSRSSGPVPPGIHLGVILGSVRFLEHTLNTY
jgi:ABC-type transport system substrate-binding protein